jgi:hypothetical protein
MWIPVLVLVLHAGSAFASPAKNKVSGWVHAWDDPKTVQTAKMVGVGALALLGVILVLGRVAKRQEEQRRRGR